MGRRRVRPLSGCLPGRQVSVGKAATAKDPDQASAWAAQTTSDWHPIDYPGPTVAPATPGDGDAVSDSEEGETGNGSIELK
jgi:hypothetical protein